MQEMTPRSRRRLLGGALVLSAAAVVIALLALSLASGSSEGPCGRGTPASKCQPGGSVAGPGSHSKSAPTPAPSWLSPPMVDCGDTFFSEPTRSQLSDRFGSIDCFRFENRDQWVVMGDGMARSGAGPAPGGPMVAVETCAGADESTCLDANANHDFGGFTVLYPPDPMAWPVKLQATFGGRLLYIQDGPRCGLLTLDLSDRHWYGRSLRSSVRRRPPEAIRGRSWHQLVDKSAIYYCLQI